MSTALAIFNLYTRIENALNKGNYACIVFLDFVKLFDTINHEILMAKLENYGIRGPVKDLLESYLNKRKQVASVDNIFSDQKKINCGVLQGSIPGPMLFSFFNYNVILSL